MLNRLRASIREKGLLCTFWMRREWYVDSAMFTSARRCGHAEALEMLRLLERERRLWSEAPRSLSPRKMEEWVLDRVFSR